MHTFLTARLQAIEDVSNRNLSMLELILTRAIVTHWIILDLVLNLIFDSLITSFVIIYSLYSFVARNNKVLLFLLMSYAIFRFIVMYLLYIVSESID
ncbi:hypothetical protein FPV129 [Fowlpox virus]|uniref:Protein FPV129 n=2 Tax=Fowlpox virus TaxID=10261 RepID=L2_FOWPN|nr:hypothetical protein FPV129 [Fowlpox virus]P15911.1 RecName: Full=Protein FPV129 [Fowlpox virus strain NVSL]UNS14345.1 ALPV-181 [Albatrosspox virus]WPD90836.1 MC070-like hypothetical protein [Avipoxvirus sp.]CAE52668.1 L2R orthologue [Fowlpox virus isolate HP-438/Munich]AAF44473.1 ORF FPV129 [Fowlpox virus]ART91562.1 L2R ortholog [Fowlpox virus]